MTRLILVRCGITDWNKVKRIQGAIDIPLNDEGKVRAVKLGEELSHL
ncbi:MAG: phosphoglycerate mutase family protein, partial [Candidatus Omnitrophica bacterium]|nr:phosphoglycerate mutase family protein [Candidatus Omnitrophota bacterium]